MKAGIGRTDPRPGSRQARVSLLAGAQGERGRPRIRAKRGLGHRGADPRGQHAGPPDAAEGTRFLVAARL